jgi:hypothetical protein
MPDGALPSPASNAMPDDMASRRRAPGIAPATILAALAALFGIDHLLLLRFLGVSAALAYIGEAVLLVGLCCAIALGCRHVARIGLTTFAACLAIAAIVLLLGGEGRIFYANLDWQVRDAALHDMVIWPWPFAYSGLGAPSLLRAPIGMYLLPALAGKLAGQAAADWALLVQNSVVLAAILALGSTLFGSQRSRRIGLGVLLLFSGMDTIGVLITDWRDLLPLTAHIEGWAGLQYSSNLTLAFWVPQHAIVGWLGAILYLLWRAGKVPLAGFLAMIPLTVLWSPLGVMGTVPFAAIAGIETIWRRRLDLFGVAAPLAACLVAAASLAYLAADAGHVGAHIVAIPPVVYLAVELTEVLPFTVAILLAARGGRFGGLTFAAVLACLLLFPFLQVGHNVDFMMRASIPALAILAVLSADMVDSSPRLARMTMIVVLAIGAMTPLREVARAITYKAAPAPLCDVSQAWDQSFADFGKDTYFARVSVLPAWLRADHFAVAPPTRLARCWTVPWRRPRFGG